MILIVDDKSDNIFALKKLLEAHHFEVDTALSGEEALKKVLKTSYALIILDVQMPDMDGFEVAEALSGFSKAKDIPIIFLSAVNRDKKFITKGYTSGGIDYITKPIDPDILLLKVKTFYRLYEQARELNEIHLTLRREIVARKNAQNEQHAKAQELKSILESIPQIAFTANVAGNIEYVNEHWYGYSDHKNIFPEIYDGYVPITGFWQNFISTNEPISVEVCIRKLSNNDYRFHLLNLVPVKEEQVTVKWVGTFTDIHEQKLAKDLLEKRVEERTFELTQINDALEISNVNLQQFASVASHDLKEPLRKIQVFGSIISNRYKERLDPQISDCIDKIVSSSDRMTTLINELLAFSSLSAPGIFQYTNLNDIVASVIADLEIVIREKNAVITVNALPRIEVIPGQMRQVFQNIISNALKFTLKDKASLINVSADIVATKEIDAVQDEKGDYCRITITDNGIGFDEKYLSKIFAIFQRLHTVKEYDGTGIGLAIAKKIIDKHCGYLTARSRIGEGSEFIIIVPMHQIKLAV